MAYSDWNKFWGGPNWIPSSADGQILDYTGSTGIPAPTSSLGTQGRVFRVRNPGGDYSTKYLYHQVSSSVSSSMFSPIVSSSAYSVSTWVRVDSPGGSVTSIDVFCGLVIKSETGTGYNPDSGFALDSSATFGAREPGYRLLLTTDDINSSNRGDGNLSLKLCGTRWQTGSRILCSGSYSPGNWYRIKLELFEKANVPSIKTDELYAYLYNTGSQTWEEVGHLSIDSLTTDYQPWNSTYGRVGIAMGAESGSPNYDLLFSYDGFEISQVPWDRNNPG